MATPAAGAVQAAGTSTPETAVADAQPGASNGESSAQPPSSGVVPSLEAATQQAATAVANATQNNVQNIVVIIRINSPGDDVISQTNTATAIGAATNTAATQQGTGAGERRDGPDSTTPPSAGTNGDGTTAAGTAPTAAPAQAEPPATTPAEIHGLKHAAAVPARQRPRVSAVPRPSGDHGAASRGAAGAAAHSAPGQVSTGAKLAQSAAPSEVAPRQPAAAASRSVSAASIRNARSSVTSVPARALKSAARASTGAAHFVSSFVPAAPLSSEKADQVSAAVIMALLVVVLAVLVGIGATYVPALRARVGR